VAAGAHMRVVLAFAGNFPVFPDIPDGQAAGAIGSGNVGNVGIVFARPGDFASIGVRFVRLNCAPHMGLHLLGVPLPSNRYEPPNRARDRR